MLYTNTGTWGSLYVPPCCTQTQAPGAVCMHHRVVHKHRHLGQFVCTTVLYTNTGTLDSLYAPPCCTQTQALGAVCMHHRVVHKHRHLGQFVCTAGIDCTTVLYTNTGTWDSLYAPPCCTQTQALGTVHVTGCWDSLYLLLHRPYHRVAHKHRQLGQFVCITVLYIDTGTWDNLYLFWHKLQQRVVHKHRQLEQYVKNNEKLDFIT